MQEGNTVSGPRDGDIELCQRSFDIIHITTYEVLRYWAVWNNQNPGKSVQLRKSPDNCYLNVVTRLYGSLVRTFR